jgi:hypothetical protein
VTPVAVIPSWFARWGRRTPVPVPVAVVLAVEAGGIEHDRPDLLTFKERVMEALPEIQREERERRAERHNPNQAELAALAGVERKQQRARRLLGFERDEEQ